MMDKVIKRYGFGAKETINFCKLCETTPLERVQRVYEYLMK